MEPDQCALPISGPQKRPKARRLASPDLLRSFKRAGGSPNVRHMGESGMVPGSVTSALVGA